MQKPKVFIVEDSKEWREVWDKILSKRVTLLLADTLQEAQNIFDREYDIALIAMDACVPGSIPTTPPLVQKIRKTFLGPIIAISSDPTYNKELILAGCDHECSKEELGSFISKFLELPAV